MDLNRRPDTLLLALIAFSLLLHLLVFFWLPQRKLLPVPVRDKPVMVEIRPPTPPRQRELDLPSRPQSEQPRKMPAKRLGPSDQVVKQETAPKGVDAEDRRPTSPPPQGQTTPPSPPRVTRPVPPAPLRSSPTTPESPTAPTPTGPEIAEQPTTPAPAVPDLKTLTELPSATVARLEKEWAKEWRQKYRSEVEQGDTYWLDTEKDILISFFRRFRDQIYAVWNYPPQARERGEEGVCLLKIVVKRDGTLIDVRPLERSGSALLDDEAVAAVIKASPFGPLHSAYQEETITIFAFFHYNLTDGSLRRPGTIY